MKYSEIINNFWIRDSPDAMNALWLRLDEVDQPVEEFGSRHGISQGGMAFLNFNAKIGECLIGRDSLFVDLSGKKQIMENGGGIDDPVGENFIKTPVMF